MCSRVNPSEPVGIRRAVVGERVILVDCDKVVTNQPAMGLVDAAARDTRVFRDGLI